MQMDRFLESVAAEEACVLVHCGGGKGRAGTFAACCLAMWGEPPSLDLAAVRPVLSAQEAVRIVRSLRPGSIETQEQEAFVQAGPMPIECLMLSFAYHLRCTVWESAVRSHTFLT